MSTWSRLALHGAALVAALGGTTLVFAAMLIMNDEAPRRPKSSGLVEHALEVLPPKPPPDVPKREPPKQERRTTQRVDTRAAAPSITSSLAGVDLGMPELGGGGGDLAAAAGLAGATKDAQALVMSESAVDQPPRVTERVNPSYPARARADNIEGQVTVTLLVGADGRVEKVKILDSDPPGVFDGAALEAVRAWRFEPAMYAGKPVKVWARQVVRFGLL